MNIMRPAYMILILILWIIPGCDKENDPDNPEEPLVYISLLSEKYNLSAGETTKIKATATGSNLIYYWSASQGDILGSGAEVIYATSICQIGRNQITCKITNGKNQQESKTIEIVVVD
jgi:hypothetical protein